MTARARVALPLFMSTQEQVVTMTRMAIVYFYAQNRMDRGEKIKKALELLAAEEIVNNQQ